jgi:nucleoside 2-deoxyribosyltransferase
MKVVLTHSSNLPWKEELYSALKGSLINAEHEILFPQEKGAREQITKEHIKKSDIVLAEVSYPSTGQGIELGWADALGIPTFCFYKEGSNISSSLQYITDVFVEYSTMEDMTKKVASQLNRF